MCASLNVTVRTWIRATIAFDHPSLPVCTFKSFFFNLCALFNLHVHSSICICTQFARCTLLPGLYFYGVSEPIYYYRLSYENKLFKVPFQNDDQRAQQALFVVLYHWGFHAWGCYILVALLLGFVAFRWDMPMTFRIAFYPLLGDVVHGLFGDFVDSVSMACTTFGVCTSLGFGVDIILAGLRRVECGIYI